MIGDEPTNTDPVQKLRAALHDKAKSAPNFRFYSLFRVGLEDPGHETRYQARIVNYADDFVIPCRRRADDALAAMRAMMVVPDRALARLSPGSSVAAPEIRGRWAGIPPVSRQPSGA